MFANEEVLRTAVAAVRELMTRKLGGKPAEQDAQALMVGLEELNVLWEALQHQAEHLARERERYAGFFEYAPDAYFVTDANGIVREANRAAALLAGRDGDRLVGKPLARLVPMAERATFRAMLAGLQPGTDARWSGLLLSRDEYRRVEMHVCAAAVRRGSGDASCYWLVRPA